MLILDITKMSLKFKHDEGPEDLMPKVSGRIAKLRCLVSHLKKQLSKSHFYLHDKIDKYSSIGWT